MEKREMPSGPTAREGEVVETMIWEKYLEETEEDKKTQREQRKIKGRRKISHRASRRGTKYRKQKKNLTHRQ